MVGLVGVGTAVMFGVLAAAGGRGGRERKRFGIRVGQRVTVGVDISREISYIHAPRIE